MSDLQQWLGALFGHWQHWLGGASIGAAVALAVILAQRLFNRRVTGRQSAAIFLICFGADASYLAWHDQYLLNRQSPIAKAYRPTPPPATSAPPTDLPAIRQTRDEAGTLANEITAFYTARNDKQPRSPDGDNAAGAEWAQFANARDRYNRETLSEFKTRFGAKLTDLLRKLDRAGIEIIEVRAVYSGLSHPNDVKDIAVRLNALSKE